MQKANISHTRTHNSRLVLRAIYSQGPVSRADLVRMTDLTAPTVSDVVIDLLAQGLVEEVGYGPSTGGKRPILLRVVDDARHLISLDLGRGDFRGVLANLRGNICHRIDLPLPQRNGEAALASVYELVDRLVAAAGRPLLGIGLGAPGLVDSANGVVQRALAVDWQDLPLRELLESRYRLPAYMANDCQVAALAESTFGRGELPPALVVIDAGYDVGAGIILNGQLLHGNPYGAGEIGHVRVVEHGEQCVCGHYGCLETVASSRALLRRARAIAADSQSLLSRLVATPDAVNLEAVCEALRAGDPPVLALVREIGVSLGIAAANLVGVLGSCRIVLAGSLTCFGSPLIDTVREEMAARVFAPLASSSEIEFASLAGDVVVLGAAALVLSNELGLL